MFDEATRYALGARIREASHFYHDAAAWQRVQQCAMRQDFSWDDAAANYEALYQSLRQSE